MPDAALHNCRSGNERVGGLQVFLGFASRHSVTSANAPAYHMTWQGPWPSILFASDAHVRLLAHQLIWALSAAAQLECRPNWRAAVHAVVAALGSALHRWPKGVWRAQYSVTNVTGHPLSDDCTALVQQAASQTAGRAEVINNVTVLLRGGPADTLQPVYAYGTNTQGRSTFLL